MLKKGLEQKLYSAEKKILVQVQSCVGSYYMTRSAANNVKKGIVFIIFGEREKETGERDKRRERDRHRKTDRQTWRGVLYDDNCLIIDGY